ncbi:DEAD/DEAH box helicase [Deinococcus radiodurans]|uniref:Transcription-repair-coupling factor n=1 Tax=Deinococcus radiodurans (strain ATCC 13939 / DSM 20539 / JCM 16871 / CCUG 27074 / LMG 4051 / NBRC 15346 / NCIMB 9279 / VKM B-1422 / R1) TaxID=243230 RepID=Q9RU62_DEIRA|nr:transcription-repair coupling factor [Deinococcus radiodurans]AAF11095.1 transcription-repair coupling factor [Deinococcus radiodurans R1 = ATCC 13939 = DSM 20539]ANC71343.1 transcription-repair coupling factor [Deinococcus radiodurans R1 = ATCC 13939 = DSM 20539]QEM70972.1 transcription-repair coupling factor [Deinococcus radiodurans]QIP29531.1 transcription-repair coupling factor [Deinococcus radiodurans]QIP31781.1 transcription-repair coupling factor [Deinococcus radiodurans]
MTLSATPNLAKLLDPAPPGNLLLLPQVARMALFAAFPGPAVLLTTPDRVANYATAAALGAPVSINPGLREWETRAEHVVLDVNTALDLFPARPEDHALSLRVGASYPREELLARLERFGYERGRFEDRETDEPGFDLRGDTLELHLTPGAGLPADAEEGVWLRAEFFGDELDTLRQLRPGELTGEKIQSFTLAPTADYLTETKWDATRLELLPGRVFLDSPEFYASALEVLIDTLWPKLAGREVTSFGRTPLDLPDLHTGLETLPFYRARLADLERDVAEWRAGGYRVFILVRHDRTAAYLADKLLGTHEIPWLKVPRLNPGELGFLRSGGEGGFVIPEHKTVVITEDLIYGFQGGSALRGKKMAGRPVTDALGLSVGDFLIHPEHGIGQFLGLETRKVLGVTRDYLNIGYRGGSRLSVPIEQLPILRRHPGTTDDPPQLSSFDKKDWARAKEKARKNAEEVAAKLLVQYAARQVTPGNAFDPQPEWDEQVEKNFEFELTKDQVTALKETMRDLEKPTPADRLISGDVGFGKTEVALRAAHRVVGHGKQVAVLVPTTLLAEQHTATFVERFKGLPVRVEGLSRFTTDKQARNILAELKAGRVDILIGTHRLLSGDIEFKDLGLIIVDEEHRFGVGQKEKLRQLRGLPEMVDGKLTMTGDEKAVDTLALSATPIPRTLYMSMVGLRDMSSIQTPPKGRRPIQTILSPFDPLTVRDAIMTEIGRGGKVFYIHDRIASIGARSLYLRNLVPEARIGVAHGRMNEEELEEIMLGFEQGAFDVLLATTIVETGLDIPEANTILIERSDRLGLAQLYQLRGRVGRRAQTAYAYLFYPPRMTENAQRRLWAIADLQDLGSGHLLAEKDMEIRGVGNILGEEQHGHVQAVSIDVYTELLAEAVAKLKGEKVEAAPSISIDLPVNARLTPEYFVDADGQPNEGERIATYGRLSDARTLQAISRVERDLRKKYGPPTPEVQNFIDLAKLRLTALAKRVLSIGETMTQLQITFAYKALDYDAPGLKKFPHKTEVVTFPPSVKIDKRGIKPDEYARMLIEVLGYFG